MGWIFNFFSGGVEAAAAPGVAAAMRLVARQGPGRGPYFLMASMAYWEQEGT